jgi:muconolactone delta-isomerase
VRFVVMSRSVPGADRSGLEAEEYLLVDELHATGFFEQIYLRGDHYGAVAIVSADSEEAVRRQLGSLPFATNGCVEIEHVIEVTARW